MLAATATGAIWTSCSPDFGSQGVVDRFGQVQPSVLIVANGYNYNGKVFSLEDKINKVLDVIDAIENVIEIEFVETSLMSKTMVINFDSEKVSPVDIEHILDKWECSVGASSFQSLVAMQ